MPVEQSILWKPLRDPHYVIASLQPADGGRRRIFVRQRVLSQIQAIAHTHGRRAIGLLFGQFYVCSETGVDYEVVESVVEQSPAGDDAEAADTITTALADRGKDRHGHVLGWYRGAAAVEATPPLSTAGVHSSLFPQPWQAVLVVSETHGSNGAFFLRDTVNGRWFTAPFYELLDDHAPAAPHPKPTSITWPQYLTADNVVTAAHRPVSPNRPADVRPVEEEGGRTQADRVPAEDGSESTSASVEIIDGETIEFRPATGEMRPVTTERPATDRPATRPVPSVADVAKAKRNRAPEQRASERSDKASIGGAKRPGRESAEQHRVRDDEDTTMGDNPRHYLELARAEGFFVAATFGMQSGPGPRETLWVLNEAFSGLLLTVVTTDTEVVDATLHYNLQTDDAGLQRVPFPAHRDLESKTVYIRETCTDSLRARCHRLRASNALVREWRVSPTLSLITPSEWESVPLSDSGRGRGADSIGALNNARIAELPEGVRSQFHLARTDAPA